MTDADPYETNIYMAKRLGEMGLAYTSWIEPRVANSHFAVMEKVSDSLLPFRAASKGAFLVCGGHTAQSGTI